MKEVSKTKTSKKNRKAEKNIEVRSDGYSYRVRMKIGETFINETFFNIDEARAYRDLLRAGKSTDLMQEKVLRAKAEKKKSIGLTLGKLLEQYQQEVTIHKKGWKEETYLIGKLLRYKRFSDMPIYLVDGLVVESLKAELSKTLANTTVRKYLMLLSHLFRVAITKRWCRDLQNPVKAVELPKTSRMRSRRLEHDEHFYLITELGRAKNSLILPFFEFLIETACRRGEALRLMSEDVDLTTKTAILRDTKNGEDRIIGLSIKAVSILKPLVASSESGNVIYIGKQGKRKLFPLKICNIRHAFEQAIGRAKKAYISDCLKVGRVPCADFLQDFRLHDARREATSQMFEKGLDIMEVSAMTGHKTLSMLRGYTNLRARDLAKKLG